MAEPSSHDSRLRLTSNRFISFLLFAVVITRIPYLMSGYGSDPDAWLVASSASTLWQTGQYFPSRLPGYPLYEVLMAPMIALGGSFLSNTLTLLITLVTILIWFHIAQRHSPHPRLLTLALAFAPVVWQHSGDTMDYLWSLCFALGALVCAENRRVVLSAVLTGLAIGFRLSNTVFAIPLLVLLLVEKNTRKEVLIFCVTCIGVSIVVYLPLLTKYGLPGWIVATRVQMGDIHPNSLLQRAIAFGYRTVYSIGPITALLAGLLLWRGRANVRGSFRTKEPIIVFSSTVILVYTALFWLIPLDRAYLLPAMPFLFLVVSRSSSTKQFAAFTFVLIFSGLWNIDVIDKAQRRQAHLNLHEGMVIEEFMIRQDKRREREAIAELMFNHKAIVMTSDPTFWFENTLVGLAVDPGFINRDYEARLQFESQRRLAQKRDDTRILFIRYLLKDEVESATTLGYRVYCVRRAQKSIEREAGYALEDAGVTVIDVMH